MDFVGRADWLTDLERDQFADDKVPEGKRENEGGDRRGDSAKGDVTENVESFDVVTQEMEVIHHEATSAARCLLANSSSTCSIRAARLPLIKIKSPGTAFCSRSAAASSGELTE